MTKDEKKTIYYFKNEYTFMGDILSIKLNILLNLVEKQQKEIEDSIPKEAIRKLYNKYFEHIKKYDKENLKRDSYYYECIKVCDILKELLEG